jgi:rubrerythrin
MEFENLKAIIDFAIEKETEAAEFYETTSREESMSGKKEMLLEFAQQERKHKDMLEKFLAEGIDAKIREYKFKWITDIKRSDYVDEVAYHRGMPYNEMLMLAMKREEKALKLYNALLAKTDHADAKKLFKVLCQEEAKHKLALETLYDDFMAEMGD